jgi:hypothetical protein
MRISVMFFSDPGAQTKDEESIMLPVLAELIRAASAPEKARLPWLKLARFGNARSPRGSLRHDRNVIAISGIEADYDAERIGFDAATETAAKAGLLAILYTSASHTAERPPEHVIGDEALIDAAQGVGKSL